MGKNLVASSYSITPILQHSITPLSTLPCSITPFPAPLPIRLRHHDEPVKVFHRPSRADELGREPIEQFGMGRRHAVIAEITWRRNEAPSEMSLPDPVHHDPRRERIRRIGNPVGEGETALLLGRLRGQ